MIKQPSLLKWSLSNKNVGKGNNHNWIHPPEALQTGHVAYLVKFLGKTDASEPKGISVVKESIQKLKFNHQLRQSEKIKIPKVELTVSVDGVAVQDPRTKQISYQYPLHQISYCADDKSDKKLFSFIAKEPNTDKHTSFVFASEKLAEEITLTIGQAFDLAYRRFLDTSGKELEMKRRIMILQKRVQDLEIENKKLHEQLSVLQQNKQYNDFKSRKSFNSGAPKNNVQLKGSVCPPAIQPPPLYHKHSSGRNAITQDLLGEFDETPKSKEKYNDFFEDIKELENTYNGNVIKDNNCISLPHKVCESDKFQPSSHLSTENDPFGMGDFASAQLHGQELKNAIGEVDRRLLEMRDGFQRGLSFGNDDFSAECFDFISK